MYTLLELRFVLIGSGDPLVVAAAAVACTMPCPCSAAVGSQCRRPRPALLPRFPPRFLPPATAVAFPFVRLLLLLRSDLVRSVHRLVGPRSARSSICPCWCLKLSVGTASRCFNLRPKHAPRNASMQRPSIIYPAPRAPCASSN